MTTVWIALLIETGAALGISASLVGWARRYFATEAGPAEGRVAIETAE
ncbi:MULTISPECIES: hypothetical protein [Actinomadura]|uniref:Uncharacterized protein n=1 Tax=Actinomadura yumaensis TaxID=111807 RepID=A0ABW2CNG9_9ACTN|nr:hypothetical protein [Actinomadura sp. J1-007]